MNPLALYFASGESLYAGVAILMLVIVVSPFLKHQWMLRLRSVVAWLALALIVMACPPFSWIIDAIFLALFATWFILSKNRTTGKTLAGLRGVVGTVLFMLLLVLSLLEFPHRTMPVITGEPSDHLVVIGDSISSGINPRVSSWPVVMQESTGVPVKSLARPGAQAMDGEAMARQVKPDDRIVVVEIGGNDLLLGTPSKEFAQDVNATLSELAAPGRTVVMFELPLLPHKIAYGQIQRRLATKYGVFLIPKRYFADVLGGADATSDGLHLSDLGARRMATLVAQALSHVLELHGQLPAAWFVCPMPPSFYKI
jgi:lysophospholipase L1-like esterase